MRSRDDFASSTDARRHFRQMNTRTPRQILEWLCEGDDFRHLWKTDGSLNIHRLHTAIKKAVKGATLTQSTLARAYQAKNGTAAFSDDTIEALSQFFEVPKPIIRGELTFDPVETWGMDINTSELRLLRLVKLLTPDQRRLLFEQVRLMIPEELRGPPIGGLPHNVTQLAGRRTKR